MKITALMLCRNEEWIVGLSSYAASLWCDELVLTLHGCTDKTEERAVKPWDAAGKRFYISRFEAGEHWDEMDIRQNQLELARSRDATHIAMVDADEVPTANVIPRLRDHVAALSPHMVLNLPMIPMRSLDSYQDDGSVWTRAKLSLAFCDAPGLTWKPAEDGYHFHHRCPYGVEGSLDKRTMLPSPRPMVNADMIDCQSGVMHLQFANERRLKAKHCLYTMWEYLRWPNKRTKEEINHMYGQALICGNVSRSPKTWWNDGANVSLPRHHVDLDSLPWHEEEIRRLMSVHGRSNFDGLDLRGY